MDWKSFLEQLLKDFRYSTYKLEKKHNIKSATISKILTGKTKKPSQETIEDLEKVFKIKIDDSNPQNLTYRLTSDIKESAPETISIHNYPIVSQVYAGPSMSLFVQENISEYVNLPYEKKENCFAIRVHGDSMNHKIEQGDIVLADMDKEVINGCIVVARLKDGRQIIKRFREIEGSVAMFYSDNGNYEPLTVPKAEIEAIYRIIGIWKKL